MKLKDALKLKSGQKAMHKRYGECIVKEVIMSRGELFGVVITPITEDGRILLCMDSETEITDLLEDSYKLISLENNIPGSKPIDHETAWGVPEEDLPETEPKNHFASKDEEVPGGGF